MIIVDGVIFYTPVGDDGDSWGSLLLNGRRFQGLGALKRAIRETYPDLVGLGVLQKKGMEVEIYLGSGTVMTVHYRIVKSGSW